jgi:competence protein ComEC
VPLKKLKTTSPYKKTTVIFLFLSIIFVIYKINNITISKYKKETQIKGIIYECQNKADSVQLKIHGKENVIINYYHNFKCNLGIKIKANGELEKPKSNTISHLFNYRNYLLSQNINYTFKAKNIKIINNQIPKYYRFKNMILNHTKSYKSQKYINALVLGNSHNIEENIKESYQNNGISHLLAISGTQITILSIILFKIFNYFLKNNLSSYIITIILLLIYLFVTSFSPSIIRAVLLFIIITIKKNLNLKISTIYLLINLLSIWLLINPYSIYNLGFTLSFTVSIYLLLFKNLINNKNDYFTKTLTISIIAFLSSSPLIIQNFFHLNLLTPIINLYFVPLITFLIYPLALLTFIFKPLDNLLNTTTTFMELVSLKINKINFLDITLSSLNILGIIFYFLIITYILYKWQKSSSYLFIFLIVIFIHHNINLLNPNTTLTMIDVGQGDSILIKLKYNQGNILIDTGGQQRYDGKKEFDISQNITIPYLKAEGIDKLDYLILTHGDYDHAGMAPNLVNNFKIEKVIFNINSYNELEKKLIKILDQKKIKHYKGLKKIIINKNNLIFLNNKIYKDENNSSNVIYFKLYNYKFLLMGDAGIQREKDIIKKYKLTNIDFLKIGHHGSNTSSSKEFIDSIKPKTCLISVGKNNRYGLPKKNVLKTLNYYCNIYRTDINGSIEIKLNKNGYKLKTYSP